MLLAVRGLILGASGYLGRHVYRRARAMRHEVVGAGFRSATGELRSVDIRDADAVGRLVRDVLPDYVVNTASVKDDWQATAVGPLHVARACVRNLARLVQVSSDAVFSGDRDSYDESCAPSPLTAYGAAKAAAEADVRATPDDSLIVRTSWIVGDGDSPFERLVHALAHGTTDGALFDDDIRCPVHVADLAAALVELGGREDTGVLHVAGADALSRAELGRIIAAQDGLDPGALPTARKSSVGERGTAIRLDSRRARRLLATPIRGADSASDQLVRRVLGVRSPGTSPGMF